ncbi:lymphocyte expansion molecule isoform X2 [Belonocnema kinseyi]|nr:lymphocyte expansion molecule isoform X2 [Belonocnema kinseyi]
MEEFSATQGGRLLGKFGILEKEKKSNIGPGTYQLDQWPENIFEKRGRNVKGDIGFGTMSRFPKKSKFSTPGPGYTGRDHNPFFYIDQNRFKGFSSTPSFEYDGLAPRIKKEKTWSLPPNRYNVQHPDCIDNVLKKVTGKRGPYDLFTGPRDNSTITGYLATTKIFGYPDWPQKIPGEIEKLFNKSNYFKGVWSNCPRYPKKPTLRLMQNDLSLCYKDPSQPGPGQYDPKFPERPKNAKNYPFGKSAEKDRPLRPKEIRPGPGRYNPKIAKNIKGSGWSSVFKSKIPRIKNLAKETYNSF